MLIETKAFKKAVETAFKIVKEGKVLDVNAFAHEMQISLGRANQWLNKMTKLRILLKISQVAKTEWGWGARKHVYVRNVGIEVRVSPKLQQKLFAELLRKQQRELYTQ